MTAAAFERPHHRRIAQVLQALDGSMLRDQACLFGGGTVMALRYGEYRESVDIDFLVSDVAGYRHLRQRLTDLTKAINRLRDRPGRLERCLQAMAMVTPRAVLWQRIRALTRVLPMPAA